MNYKKTLITMQDSFLFQAIKNNNEKAFKAVFEAYYKPLCVYIKSFTKDLDTAEEIVQSTFITLWTKRAEIEIHTSLKSYLYTMSYNNYLQNLKQIEKQEKLAHKLQIEALNDIENESDKNQETTTEKMLQVIKNLPNRCQEIINLRLEGLKYQEIADHLNISIKTVENQMGIAFSKIRESFNNKFP